MILIPQSLASRLLKQGAAPDGTDHRPLVKLFSPIGAATWLISEMQPDRDTLFGLCDLGLGCPELGYVSLSELQALRLPGGLRIERDRFFTARFAISVYAAAAHRAGGITEAENLLREAAEALGQPVPPSASTPFSGPPHS